MILSGVFLFSDFLMAGAVPTAAAAQADITKKMYQDNIHPADKMLIDMFGHQLGMAPLDFSTIQEDIVCEQDYCAKDTLSSQCYRGFKGDIQNPEAGCTGYQRKVLRHTMNQTHPAEQQKPEIAKGNNHEILLPSESNMLPQATLQTDEQIALHHVQNAQAPETVDMMNTPLTHDHQTFETPHQPLDSENTTSQTTDLMTLAGFGTAAVTGAGAATMLNDDDTSFTPDSMNASTSITASAETASSASTNSALAQKKYSAFLTMQTCPTGVNIADIFEKIMHAINKELGRIKSDKHKHKNIELFIKKLCADLNFIEHQKNIQTAKSLLYILKGQISILYHHGDLQFMPEDILKKIMQLINCLEYKI